MCKNVIFSCTKKWTIVRYSVWLALGDALAVLPNWNLQNGPSAKLESPRTSHFFPGQNRTRNDRNVQVFLYFSFFWRKRTRTYQFSKWFIKKKLIIVYCDDIYFVTISNFWTLEKYSYLHFSLTRNFELKYNYYTLISTAHYNRKIAVLIPLNKEYYVMNNNNNNNNNYYYYYY